MNNLEYNENRYNRKKQWYRLRLGIQQLKNYPIINLIWALFIVGIFYLNLCRNIVLNNFDVPQILESIFRGSLWIFEIIFPVLVLIGTLQGIGEITSRRDEADVYRAFSDRRDVKNEAPILVYKKKIKGKNVIIREFYTTIPMERWQHKKEAISDIMNIHIIGDIEYSNHNGNRIVFKSAKGRKPSERGILYDDTF